MTGVKSGLLGYIVKWFQVFLCCTQMINSNLARKVLLILVVTCVCVLSCFLAKFVRYIKERSSKMYEVEMFFMIVFNSSMENRVCGLCCKPRGKGKK